MTTPHASARLSAPAGAVQDEQDRTARISARFIEPDGTPAAGAHWKLDGQLRNDRVARPDVAPPEWNDLEGVIGDDGRMEIRFIPPEMFTFDLAVKLPGCATTRWWFLRLDASSDRALGTVRLEPECRLIGRIVDLEDEPLDDVDWIVRAIEYDRPATDGRIETGVRVDVPKGQDTFELGGLSAGRVRVSLTAAETHLRNRVDLVVEHGPPLERKFVFDVNEAWDPRPHVSVSCIHFGLVGIPLESVSAVDEDGRDVPVTAAHDRSSELRVGTGKERALRLVIDDSRFERWQSGLLRPGDDVAAHLEGSSQLGLRVSGPTGDAVERFSVTLHQPWSDRTIPIHPSTVPLSGGVLEGVMAGRYEVVLRAEGLVGRTRPVLVEATSRTDVDVVLQPWIGVTGSVAYPDGEPASNTEVVLLRVAAVDDSPRSPIVRGTASGTRPHQRRILDESRTDSLGSFTLEAPSAGTYALFAMKENQTWVTSESFEVGDSSARFDLVLPRGAVLSGHVAFPNSLPSSGWEVHVARVDHRHRLDPLRSARPRVDADGAFVVTGRPRSL